MSILSANVTDHKDCVRALLTALHSEDAPRLLALWKGVVKYKDVALEDENYRLVWCRVRCFATTASPGLVVALPGRCQSAAWR